MIKMHHNSLYLENIELNTLAKEYGTPLYAYSKQSITHAFKSFDEAFGNHPHTVCYAVKANSNLAILNILAKLGSGFDIVSGGELIRALKAGADPQKIVFSGVGKSAAEIVLALNANIGCFNVESAAELLMLNDIAQSLNKKAPISLRVNPNVDAKTHPYISTGLKENKFGIAIETAFGVYQKAHQLENINIVGIDCHIGSQLTELSPYHDTLGKLLALIDQLAEADILLQHLDVGGGIGITYQDETPLSPKEWITLIKERVNSNQNARHLHLIVEPGRAIVANAGVLLTEVILTKTNEDKHFAVVDAAMNDLIRPTLYSAWMRIMNTQSSNEPKQNYDIVGPICETSDFLGKDRELSLKSGDILAVLQAGAYGFTMSSNYNSRPRACELLIDNDQVHIIRQRETIESLFALETMLD